MTEEAAWSRGGEFRLTPKTTPENLHVRITTPKTSRGSEAPKPLPTPPTPYYPLLPITYYPLPITYLLIFISSASTSSVVVMTREFAW